MARGAAGEVIEIGMRAATAYDRGDLVARLEQLARRVDDPEIAVMVVGEFKQGKSSLVNGIVKAQVCPVDDDVATAVPTVVRHGEAMSAAVIAEDDGVARSSIGLDEVSAYVTGAHAPSMLLRAVEVTIPRPLLSGGLTIVDTPGAGGLASDRAAAALGAVPSADAVLFVSDASQELTHHEFEFVRRAAEVSPQVALVLTKIDLSKDWRAIAAADRAHLREAGLAVPLIPVSSLLRERSSSEHDGLDVESGYPVLIEWLRSGVMARVDAIKTELASTEVVSVCDLLQLSFDAERLVLESADAADELVAELRRVEARAQQLESGASRWQSALADGMQDLIADAEHDLRARFRDVLATADERIDESDPVDTWAEFQPWLRLQITEAVAANYQLIRDRTTALSERIAELFLDEHDATALLALLDGRDEPSQVADDELDAVRAGVVANALVIARGGYSGMLMFGMLASMAGLSLAAPVSLVIGVAMGRRQQRDEKRRQLTQRRQQAKQTYRKYVDGVSFVVSKQTHDTLRRVQRALRDEWADRARELQRSAHDALRSADAAVKAAAHDRQRRLADIDAELDRIRLLRERAVALRASVPA